jgi:ornithine cyclodeaminase/alanine dehydrogenase-like protein (mu-crystallin family)
MPEIAEVDSAHVRRACVVLVDSRSACAQEAGEFTAAGVSQARMVEVGKLVRRAWVLVRGDEEPWDWEPDAHRTVEQNWRCGAQL